MSRAASATADDGLSLTEFRPRKKKANTAPADPAARRRALRALTEAFPDESYEAVLAVVAGAARLSPLEKQVLAYQMDGLTLSAVAAVLEKRLGTIHSAAARAKRKLLALRQDVRRNTPNTK
jgi:DNA-directed RNA polymerase specialized sigma24 family protein